VLDDVGGDQIQAVIGTNDGLQTRPLGLGLRRFVLLDTFGDLVCELI
jgi:hypothetical protein